MTELASVRTEQETNGADTVVIRSCANGWVVQQPGSEREVLRLAECLVFTSLWDMKNWLSDNLIDNT